MLMVVAVGMRAAVNVLAAVNVDSPAAVEMAPYVPVAPDMEVWFLVSVVEATDRRLGRQGVGGIDLKRVGITRAASDLKVVSSVPGRCQRNPADSVVWIIVDRSGSFLVAISPTKGQRHAASTPPPGQHHFELSLTRGVEEEPVLVIRCLNRSVIGGSSGDGPSGLHGALVRLVRTVGDHSRAAPKKRHCEHNRKGS